jgi:FkbM family methyltransferase
MMSVLDDLRRTAGVAYRAVRPRPEVAAWRQACRIAARTPRYTPGEITLGPLTIEYPDLLTICPQWHDLFVQRTLDFSAATARPRVLDCGANVGLASLFVKSRYPDARISAFEADPAIAAMCRRNLARNGAGDVEVIDAAVWTGDGVVGFEREGSDSGAVCARTSATTSVRAIRLKTWLQREPVDLLKLDIEGAEGVVLRDAADALGSVRALVIDLHEFDPEVRDSTAVFDILRASGFTWSCSDLVTLPWRGVAAVDTPFPGRATSWALTVHAWRAPGAPA